jgi:hypothetical protein
MQSNHSILWNDSTLEKDKALVRYLVENIVVGKRVAGHYDKCIEKIMSKIQTKEWQVVFPQRTHVFSVYYGVSIKGVIEIKLSLYAQALELLYFNIASTSKNLKLDTGASFSKKLSVVFREVYKWNMPQDTANAIRILRNDVMHTGTIAGVLGAYRNQRDPAKLTKFFEKYDFDQNQLHTDVQNRMHIAHMFNLLVEDMLIRTLGLDQNDLNFNGAPIWNSDIFGYDHDNRPDWLRVPA